MFTTRSEWEQIRDEYSFGVQSVSTDGMGLKMTLLEGDEYTITFQGSGFRMTNVDNKFESKTYESMDALLNDVSPKYRDAVHKQLSEKLMSLQN
jgi:Protein of unknown function (DUF727)